APPSLAAALKNVQPLAVPAPVYVEPPRTTPAVTSSAPAAPEARTPPASSEAALDADFKAPGVPAAANETVSKKTKRPASVNQAPLVPSDRQTKELLLGLKQAPTRTSGKAVELKRLRKEHEARAKREKKLQADLVRHNAYAERVSVELGVNPDRPVTQVPELDENRDEVDFITVQADRSFIRISFDTQANRHIYEVIEPTLDAHEAEVLELVRDTLIRTMEARPPADEDQDRYLQRSIDEIIVDHSILIDQVSRQRVQYYIVRDFLGYGPIDALMKDPMIEDISCDGPGVPLFLFHRQFEAIETNVVFKEEGALDSFVVRLAQRCGKQISIAEPLLDATLPDKSRLQVALSREVTTRGSAFTIRKFRSDPFTPTDLIRYGTMSAEMGAYFWMLIENGMSLIYAGGTASGKTSSLNAIATFIPSQKKIVSIEDTREINIMHRNWIAGLTRTGFGGEVIGGKVAGTIDMYKLLEAAMRQRPEYLVVGEVRGPEALTLFQAMATGHATYSTMHADSAPSAVYRLENPPINVPRIMLTSLSVIAIQMLTRIKDRTVRRCKEIVEVVGIDPDTKDLITNTVFQWDSTTDTFKQVGKSRIFKQISQKKSMTSAQIEVELANRAQILRWMVDKGIRRLEDVSNVIANYYNRSQALMDVVHGKPPEAAPNAAPTSRPEAKAHA
ncbi:MAG: Flp pilus assembly complex ATPase component TadA, partial [Euryarchaeota archaeon]|nr:Flp pilus assembly complex ATPase component TadA [Euryarchaeota archaeon]